MKATGMERGGAAAATGAEIFVVGVGVGDPGPAPGAGEILARAGLVAAAERFRPLVPPGCRWVPVAPVAAALERVGAWRGPGPAVVLASGDPLFFGIGRRLLEAFGPGRVAVIPAVTSIQRACAAFRIPWDDMAFVSLHGRGDDILPALAPALLPGRPVKAAVLTDAGHGPERVAAALAELAPRDLRLHVAEDLGGPGERLSSFALEEAAARRFHPLNVVLVTGPAQGPPPAFGRAEAAYATDGGLITKREVRAVVLAFLELAGAGVLWDVGAGSGAVSVEACGLVPGLRAFAVERDPRRIEHVRRNRARFFVPGLVPVAGEAPAALAGLPDPDRVFLGGGAGRPGLLDAVLPRLGRGGRLVATAATLETLHRLLEGFSGRGFRTEVTEVQA
ncbi:precorrin-6y C5,15-methyltransferase (decarboxylating) subunit CbiE, partial [Dissulfurirhabdus thermomarina]